MSRISGIGMTRFTKHENRTLRELAREAADSALEDAGLEIGAVDALVFANSFGGLLQGQESVRGQVVFATEGVAPSTIINVENACASGSTALYVGHQLIRSGSAGVVLVVGAEKLWHADRQRSLAALATATDVEILDENPPKSNIFMEHYAEKGRQYLGSTDASEQSFALVAAKNSRFGALNPNAHFQTVNTAEEVMEARPIAPPLTLLMCSPISDGAAAAVLTDDTSAGPRLIGCGLASGDGRTDPAVAAAAAAFAEAEVAPSEVDCVEVHDAAAPAELIALEAMGIFEGGEAAERLRGGDTDAGGTLPVNTSGGLIRRGHPIAATGLAQIYEAVAQVRGDAGGRQVAEARIAACHNAGGVLGEEAAVTTVSVVAEG